MSYPKPIDFTHFMECVLHAAHTWDKPAIKLVVGANHAHYFKQKSILGTYAGTLYDLRISILPEYLDKVWLGSNPDMYEVPFKAVDFNHGQTDAIVKFLEENADHISMDVCPSQHQYWSIVELEMPGDLRETLYKMIGDTGQNRYDLNEDTIIIRDHDSLTIQMCIPRASSYPQEMEAAVMLHKKFGFRIGTRSLLNRVQNDELHAKAGRDRIEYFQKLMRDSMKGSK